MATPLVLITGSAGHIGQAAVHELMTRRHAVRGFDRVPTPELTDTVVGDITDPVACRQALSGVTTLIHLAATPDDVDDPVGQLFGPNIVGVYRIFEAAKEAGVKRMVVASSGQVVWNQRTHGPLPLGVDVQPSPRSWYAATKLFLEAAGRAFADAHAMSVIAVRLGWCPRPGQERELAATTWAHDIYLSRGDAGRLLACAVETASPIRFAVVYATSKTVRNCVYDPVPAKTLLGFEPRDCYPEGMDD